MSNVYESCPVIENERYLMWFVRWSVTEKAVSKKIGTIELFHRKAGDAFNEAGVLRIDVRSDYERSEVLLELFALIMPRATATGRSLKNRDSP